MPITPAPRQIAATLCRSLSTIYPWQRWGTSEHPMTWPSRADARRAIGPRNASSSSARSTTCTRRSTASSGSNVHMEDLVQDAFISIFRSLHGFRGEASCWQRGLIAASCAPRTHISSRRPPKAASLELVPQIASGDPSAERRMMMREAARRLYVQLDRLRGEAAHRLYAPRGGRAAARGRRAHHGCDRRGDEDSRVVARTAHRRKVGAAVIRCSRHF